MAEALIFHISPSGPGEEPAARVLWYQSDDGETWSSQPVDSIDVSDPVLQYDAETGSYRWESPLADPTKYHQLKTESASGIISTQSAVIPPRDYQPIVKREVDNFGQAFTDPEGKPRVGMKVTFTIVKDNVPVIVRDTETGEAIGGTVTATTDIRGHLQTHLWPTDRGPAGLKYLYRTPDETTTFALPSGTPNDDGSLPSIKLSALLS